MITYFFSSLPVNSIKNSFSTDFPTVRISSMLEKNQQFLNHDTLTDIITFDLSEKDTELLSEIYISVERIAENAKKFSIDYSTELHRVIFHGALHLCGFKDKKKEDKALMTQMENDCLEKYFTGK